MKEIKPQDYIIRQPQLRIDPFHKEGKTKHIWETKDPSLVIIESKDDITAGDGE